MSITEEKGTDWLINYSPTSDLLLHLELGYLGFFLFETQSLFELLSIKLGHFPL
jgi:hypothetical protein